MFSVCYNKCVKLWRNKKRSTKIKPFINKYNWEEINYPSEKYDWKKFEKNNVTIGLNVLHAKKEEIFPAYVSKHKSNRERQVILLMISNREKQWHFLAFKKLSSLLKGVNFKGHGDFYCLNCFHSFATENKLKSHKRVK